MIKQNQEVMNNLTDEEIQERLMNALENDVPVEDGNGHEFSFTEQTQAADQSQQTQENVDENIANQGQFNFTDWSNWVGNYLGYLDQNRFNMENLLKNQAEQIEKLTQSLADRDQKITDLQDDLSNVKTDFMALQDQLKQVLDQTARLLDVTEKATSVKDINGKKYSFEDIPGWKSMQQPLDSYLSLSKGDEYILDRFLMDTGNYKLHRTIKLIKNQDHLTSDERKELSRLMLDF